MVLDSGEPPCLVAAAEDALKQMLAGLSSGVLRPAGHQAPIRQNLLDTAYAGNPFLWRSLGMCDVAALPVASPECQSSAAIFHLLLEEVPHYAGQIVPEAFQALKQCTEMLGGEMQPPMVERLLQACAKHAKHGSPWPVRKHAVDALGALAASLQERCWLMLT